MTNTSNEKGRSTRHGSPKLCPSQNSDPSSAVYTRRLECRTVATGRFGQRHHIRDLPAIVGGSASLDSPTLLDDDVEPHPSEMLLAALNACLSVSIQANAVARGIPVRALEVCSMGDVDPSALWGTGDRRVRPIGFRSIAVEVRIAAEAPSESLRALVDYAVLWSPVANTLHDPVDLQVSLVPV
ncbi:OsmC family protein [Lichenibacterium dinghuense]|uniref:OsmC family protein n=1 Tax=Lichenibacterium dinghuense TaxID=2895977 RepID=UPI001F476A0D|nr:OsmC family protein [Lichenibacterium sp. 6Y81]